MSIKTKHALKAIRNAALDFLIIFAVNTLAFLANKSFTADNVLAIFVFVGLLSIFKIVVNFCAKEYSVVTIGYGMRNSLRALLLTFVTSAFCYIIAYALPFVPNLYFIICAFVIIVEASLTLSIRFLSRIMYQYEKSIKSKKTIPTIVIGAGVGAKLVFDECQNNEFIKNKIVAFVDDDPNKIYEYFAGLPIEGPISNIKEIIKKYHAEEIIIAIAKINRKKLLEIIDIVKDTNAKIKRIPILSEVENPEKEYKTKIINIDVNKLLAREQIKLDNDGLHDFINDKVVLVTGAGGSIGSELVRQIYKQNPSTIILFDIYENAVYDIQQEIFRCIHKDNKNIKIVTLIGATYNEARMENIFKQYHPQIVFHAAAYKHVPLMEDSPAEAIRSNVIGTYNVAKLSDKYHVEKMVLVSTDKAVRPTNVMGATKRFAEMIIQYFSKESRTTKYSAVRFGNVLGSNGSVIPLFKKQIEAGGPVTVTSLEINRFFMTIPEAVSLILQSGVYATGGEIFILDMGKPVKIIKLAENMIRQAGYEPYTQIPIEITGLRPGEKEYEELLIDLSTQIKTENEKIYIEQPTEVEPIEEEIEFISQVFELENAQDVKDLLAKVITTYHQPERDKVKV